MEQQEKTERVPPLRSGVTVARAIFCVGVFYGVMVFLNGVSMQESASLTEFGRRRDALCRLNRPLETLSRHTGAYRFRAALKSAVGRWLNQEEGFEKRGVE